MTGSILIGLGFRARSGKDTAAAEIKKMRENEYSIEIIPFAKPLKQEVNDLATKAGSMEKLFAPNYCFPRKGYVMTLPEWVKYDSNPDMSDSLCPLGKQRAFLQWYGSEYRRAEDELYWIKKHKQAVDNSSAEIVLVPDLRFANEMAYIREYGETVKVVRPGLPQGTHASETELDSVPDSEWSAVLTNDGSLKQFKQKSVDLFDDLLTRFPQGYGM